MAQNRFNGITMPVFTAFGWAEEDTAIAYALSQLELFDEALYAQLPRDIQGLFSVHGMDKAGQNVYLATEATPEDGVYILFNARPMSLEISMAITNKKALMNAYKMAEKQPEALLGLLASLGPEWNLRIQQMEYDGESGTATHYQDLFKDKAIALDMDTIITVIARGSFLNNEDKWVIPISVSRRTNSEKVAAMRSAILNAATEDIQHLMPLALFLSGKKPSKKKTKAKKKKVKAKPAVADTQITSAANAAGLEQFTYASELQPLHVRRGFINLTSEHWPFFALNARTETREVTVHYGNETDEKSAVWRLVPNDQARVVLSPTAQYWLEENFEAGDHILVRAIKPDDKRIVITLELTE
jgi:hypothetical protein